MNVNRVERVNEEIKRKLSVIISQEVKDPRIKGIITVTYVKTTQDLKFSKVGLSIFDVTEDEGNECFKRIVASRGFMRTKLAHELDLRSTPELIFERDRGMDESENIERLLKQINSKE